MSDPSGLLDIELLNPPEQVYAGQWVPLTLSLGRQESSGSSVRVKGIGCPDREIQLDPDLLENDIEIRPGEKYQLTVPLRVARPQTLELRNVIFEVVNSGVTGLTVALPSRPLRVLPAIGQEVSVTVDPLCSYEQGTKVQLTFEHTGTTHFKDLVITLGPEGALRAGKQTIHRPTFVPGDREQVEAVVAADRLDVRMAALADGVPTTAQLSKPVGRVLDRAQRPCFRFLEPRRLSADQKMVYQGTGPDRRPVEPVHAAYPLCGGGRYEIEIAPQDPGVTDIHLRDIPGVVQVLRAERSADKRSWTFLVDVAANELFTKPEQLFYDVKRADESLTGEIPCRIQPARGKHIRLAATLGVAISAQGLAALGRFLAKADYSLEEAFSHFHVASDYQLFFPLCIPLFWVALTLYDRLQYRLQN